MQFVYITFNWVNNKLVDAVRHIDRVQHGKKYRVVIEGAEHFENLIASQLLLINQRVGELYRPLWRIYI